MNVSAISTTDHATALISISVFAPVESALSSFLEDVGWAAALEMVELGVGVLDGLFDCAFHAVVDNGVGRGVSSKYT
jgi:hypothetical protein